MKVVTIFFVLVLLLAVVVSADAAWYYKVITDDQIRNAYFAGWNYSDCGKITETIKKSSNIPPAYKDSHAEFIEQSCLKGANDAVQFKGNKRQAEKEIKYLEKLFIERIPLMKAK